MEICKRSKIILCVCGAKQQCRLLEEYAIKTDIRSHDCEYTQAPGCLFLWIYEKEVGSQEVQFGWCSILICTLGYIFLSPLCMTLPQIHLISIIFTAKCMYLSDDKQDSFQEVTGGHHFALLSTYPNLVQARPALYISQYVSKT